MFKTLCLVALAAPFAATQTSSAGLTLFNPLFDSNTHLIDENGQVVHTWAFSGQSGATVYLEEDGTLLRAKKVPGTFTFGGFGGAVERVDFNGTVLWDFAISSAQDFQHHEALPMPNGNVLVIAWNTLTSAEAIAAGRNPAFLGGSQFFPESLIEYKQTGLTTGVEVWRWSVMDHVIQDFDSTKANFGVVANHPELVDLNFPKEVSPGGEWLHANSVDYDPVFDQILFSVPFMDELWVIDHSTTTQEAAGSSGGNSGKGGDLIYRWGNPLAYGAGTAADQELFFQHGGMFIKPGRPGAGNILVFNNQLPGPPVHSEVWELTRQADAFGNYSLAQGSAYGPTSPTWTYSTPILSDLNSSFLSSAERLPNGNTLILSGAQSWFFEVTSAGAKVWEYINNLPAVGQGLVFKTRRYERYLWADTHEVSAATGGVVNFDIVTGSNHGGELYLLLGTTGGTSPSVPIDDQIFPLAVNNSYFISTLTQPNVAPLNQSFGMLDGLGRASASLTVPPGLTLAGVVAHHAFVLIDPVIGRVTLASNAQVLEILP